MVFFQLFWDDNSVLEYSFYTVCLCLENSATRIVSLCLFCPYIPLGGSGGRGEFHIKPH